jgi:hypothetical protein
MAEDTKKTLQTQIWNIANTLCVLDRKIESVALQLTHTQAFNKGLQQQMFVQASHLDN